MAGRTMNIITNPQADESTRIVAAVATVTSVATLAVGARLYVRLCMIRSFGWDDALISLTMVTSIVGFALTVVQANNGAGRHFGDVAPDVYQYGLFVNFVNQPIYLFAICFVKLAVGAALMRIATKKMYKHMILGVMGFMLFYTIACFFTIIFQCTDIRILWDPTTKATCWSAPTIRALSYTNAALNMLTDLLFSIIIPLPMLWRLHANFRTWMTLMCILGLGIFACAAAAVKVSYLPNYGKKGDFLWDSRNITIWSATEVNVAIIAASLPPLRPLFKQILSSTYARGSRGSSKNLPRGRKSWHELPSVERARPRKGMTDDTESQTALDLDNCRKHAFVHSENGNWTEIGQADVQRREDSPPGSSVLPKQEKSIVTTTTTSVHYTAR